MGHAVCFTGKEKAELLPLPEPSAAAPGHVLGRTICTLISPGTELNHGYLLSHEKQYFPGYAAVFEAEQVGDGVSGINPGELLFCMGRHQSFQHMPAKDTIPVPEEMASEQAVLVRLMNIGLTALSTTSAKPPERVIVSGAGPVGLLASWLFRQCGYEVAICEPDERRRAFAAALGAERVWPAFPAGDPEWDGQTALVLECSGHEAAALEGCRIVRRQGEVVLCGVPWKRYTDATAQELLSLVFHRYAVLRSGWEWSIPLHADVFSPRGIVDNMRQGLRLLGNRMPDIGSLSRRCSPEQAQQVYGSLAAREIKEPFVLFDWDDQPKGGIGA